MCSSDLLRGIPFLAALLFSLAAAAQARPGAGPVRVQLEKDVTVSAERIALGDVAAIYAPRAADFEKLSGLELARLPEGTRSLSLPSAYLRQRIREALPEAELDLQLPEAVSFHLQKLGWTQGDFSSALIRAARAAGKIPEGVEAEVQPLSGFERLKLVRPDGARIEPAAALDPWKGDLSFKVVNAGAEGAPFWVRARVRWFRNAWVAAKRIGFGQALEPAGFRRLRVETTALREDPVAAAGEAELALLLKNSRAHRSIAENAPLLPSQVERRPDVLPGQALRVVFRSESGVSVSAEGALVAPGVVGGAVKARLHSSKKIVIGRLVSEGLMEVNL